ncbi:MAG: helix-turn-helix domain-containing protein [Chloroflexota bacterium]|nr:helix-turn-helix domain-containing protein [Chloroflexota bacterium]
MVRIEDRMVRSSPKGGRPAYAVQVVEQRYGGMDIADILRLLYQRHGSMRAVARELDMPTMTVWKWFRRYGVSTIGKDAR